MRGSFDPDLLDRARALHRTAPLIDGHNDLAWQWSKQADRSLARLDLGRGAPLLHTDIPRLRAGGVGGQFWSVYVPTNLPPETAVGAALEQIEFVHRLVGHHPETFELGLSPGDVTASFAAGHIAALIGIEGGHSIDDSLARLRVFYRLGARYLTLTHGASLDWADSATDAPRAHGLTRFGREVVAEMNWLGMLVDLSHVSVETMHAALDVSRAPVIFSHSSARAVCDHPRNVPDGVLERVRSLGGLVMVTFVPAFVSSRVRRHVLDREAERHRLAEAAAGNEGALEQGVASWERLHPAPRATVSDVADHVDHVRSVAGVDHIGIGSDFDGTSKVPEGLEDVSKFPALTAELLRRGYGEADLRKILGGNLLRVWRAAEAVAREMQRERGPSEARIEDLDDTASG